MKSVISHLIFNALGILITHIVGTVRGNNHLIDSHAGQRLSPTHETRN